MGLKRKRIVVFLENTVEWSLRLPEYRGNSMRPLLYH